MNKFQFTVSNDEEHTIFTAECLGEQNGDIYRVTWGELDNFKKEIFKLYLPEHVTAHLRNGRWLKVS